jgi:hypothetical protein
LVGISEEGRGHDGRTFAFPYRLGNASKWLEPEVHAMFMNPSIRRTVILLESVGGSQVLVLPPGGGAGPGITTLERVDVYANVVILRKVADRGLVHIALDDIERVWRTPTGQWRVRTCPNAQY